MKGDRPPLSPALRLEKWSGALSAGCRGECGAVSQPAKLEDAPMFGPSMIAESIAMRP